MQTREIIDDIRGKVMGRELTGEEASNHLTSLSAIFGNVVLEVVEKESHYNKLLNSFLFKDESMTSAKATTMAKASDEYKDFQIARAYEKMSLELIRSLKLRIKLLSEERVTSQNL